MTGDTGRDDLMAVVAELDDEQVARLVDFARVMAQPIDEVLNPDSDVMVPAFATEFRARLQAHHAEHTTKMDRLGFEGAFLAASRAAGFATEAAPTGTTRFYDAKVDGMQGALKTEGPKKMSRDFLHVSKLSEAAWIQDMRSARPRYKRTMEFVDEFLAAVDRFFTLRYYQADPMPHYELVEIPVGHFERIKDAG